MVKLVGENKYKELVRRATTKDESFLRMYSHALPPYFNIPCICPKCHKGGFMYELKFCRNCKLSIHTDINFLIRNELDFLIRNDELVKHTIEN